MTDLELDDFIARFKRVAPAEIARFFPTRNHCIAAVRIIEQVFPKFGVLVVPLPCRFICRAPALEKMYISSPHDEVWERYFRERATSVTDRRTESQWQGHVVALARHADSPDFWLLDPTWTAACSYLGLDNDVDNDVDDGDHCLAFRLPPGYQHKNDSITCEAMTIRGIQIEITYEPIDDHGYEATPAWELDHLEPAIALIRRRMSGAEPRPFTQFVVYRRPRDLPFASIVVRRWQLIEGQVVPDKKPALVLAGPEEKALAFARERMEQKGLIRWERFEHDDPCIVEVWF